MNTAPLSLLDACHQFVHSYVFVPAFDERDRLSGVLVASDRQRRKGLLHMPLVDIIRLFERVGRDDASQVTMILNPKTGDYDVQRRVRWAG